MVSIENHIKEGLSRSYVMAVIHRAGFNYCVPNMDYGIDGQIREVKMRTEANGNKRYVDGGFQIDFQLKATENYKIEDGCIKYSLEAKNYTDLIDNHVATPRILILFTLPKERDKWLNIDSENTILKNCAWWCSLKGAQPTYNTSNVSIRIPLTQLLTVDALITLMDKVKRGELT